METLEIFNIKDVIKDYDIFLFDLWGVIIEGNGTYDGVVEAVNSVINTQNKKVYFVSNAPRPSLHTFNRLFKLGINTTVNHVMTSGELARNLLNNSAKHFNIKDPMIYHLGADQNDEILENLNVNTTTNIKHANILLMTLYCDSQNDLNKFDDLLQFVSKNQILTICANPDIYLTTQNHVRYTAGYFAKKLISLNMDCSVIYTGKPYLEIYNAVLQNVQNVPKNRILMIGDTIETDILGAQRCGIHSALVMTGNAWNMHHHLPNTRQKLQEMYKMSVIGGAVPNFVINLANDIS